MSQERLRTSREFAEDCCDVYTRMACIAAGITGQRDAAEDIVQHAITIAIEKDISFKSKDEFSAWLAEIVRRCALNHRRKTIGRKTYPIDPNILANVEKDEQRSHPLDENSGDLQPLQTSFDDQLNNALQQLTPTARCCLLLRTIERLTYKEISILMQIPEGTAMSLVHRSKSTLRDLLRSIESPNQKCIGRGAIDDE